MSVVITGNFEKQPDEKYPISVDFARWLDTSEEVSNAVVTAVVNPNASDEADATSTVISGAAQIQNGVDDDGDAVINSKVVQKVTAGTANLNYSIKILVTTTDSNIYEADLRMKVKEAK
jgi:hypothetical protein